MDTETENRVLIFSELLEKIRDTKSPITLFELSDLFDSCNENYDLIFHRVQIPYNKLKSIYPLLSLNYRIIPVVTDIDSISKKAPNGVSRFILNNGSIQIYDLLGRDNSKSTFQSRLYNFMEEDKFFRQVRGTGMEREIQERREELQKILKSR